MGGFSEISDIQGPPHKPSGTPTSDGWPRLPNNRLWSNGTYAGAFKHFNGLEKKTVMRSEDIHHTFDPVLSDPHSYFGQIDTLVDPVRIDPVITSGETT